MLQAMRKFAKGWVSSIFLGGLALSFALWGIADIFRGNSDTTVFSVGSVQVPVDSFLRDFHNAVRNNQTPPTPEQSRIIGQQVLDRMVLRIALDNLTASLGLTTSDAHVRKQIQSMPVFASTVGGFDRSRFLQIINQAQYSEDEFIAVSRRDMARDQLLRSLEAGYAMPQDYARAIFAYVQEIRAAEYVTVSPASLAPIAAPSDAVIAAYVKANPQLFSTPEYRSVTFASIGIDDVARSISVTDKQVQDDFDANKSTYVVDESRVIEQITFPNEAEANAAKAALDGGKTFDALATERKLKPADYQLGELKEADLSIDPARAKAAFALPLNGVSAPIKSSFGYVLMHVTKITPGRTKSKDDIRKDLQKQLALAKMTDMANKFTDALGGGATIADAAKKSGMTYGRIAAIDEQGLAPDASRVAAAGDPEFLTAVFKAEVGEDGDPFPTSALNYYAIRVDGVTPPKVKTLDAVRAQATSRWMAEQRVAQLRAKAEALTAKANADHSLAAVAASLGAPVQTAPPLNRGADAGLFHAALVQAIYAAPPGGAVFAQTGDGNFIIARVSGISHPAADMTSLGYLRGVGQLSGEIAGDFTLTLAKAEKLREGVKVNQALLNQSIGNNSGSGS